MSFGRSDALSLQKVVSRSREAKVLLAERGDSVGGLAATAIH
jgi:hypothetical protein